MKSTSLLFKSFTLMMALILTGCSQIGNAIVLAGSGNVKSETRTVSGFSSLLVSGRGNVIISVTGTESLTVEADDNILPLLTSDVSNGRLELGLKPNNNINPTSEPKFTLTVKSLNEITLSGAANITASDLGGDKLTVKLNGSGNITTTGKADTLTVELGGSGNFTGDDLTANAVSVVLSGSGNIRVNAANTLNVKLSGSGNVFYKGSPAVTVDKTGAGNVSKV